MKRSKMDRLCRIKPGTRFRVKEHPTNLRDLKEFRHLSDDDVKQEAKKYIETHLDKLRKAQQLLYANDSYALLIILQAIDAAGKDGMIEHVMSGVNPQGCQVASFKKPSTEELDHDFLWRCQIRLPERGRIGIFNRSYYEEVLIVRVHPELLESQKLPRIQKLKDLWEERYDDINRFERHLVRNGTVVLKFFLNVSKEEQKKRFLDRLTEPEKYWKFSAGDLQERDCWADYMEAYEEAITATSTKWAPWYVIPADHKWLARAAVSGIISHAIESLGLKPPQVSKQQLAELNEARKKLLREKV